LLLLDEPTAFLDVENRLMVLRTLRSVAEQTGTAVIFSSHDLHDSLEVVHRVLAITPDSRLLESGKEDRETVLTKAFPIKIF
jgi:ABC-type cobalamin/Fe3+-siderophores transport system ATPase subunit